MPPDKGGDNKLPCQVAPVRRAPDQTNVLKAVIARPGLDCELGCSAEGEQAKM